MDTVAAAAAIAAPADGTVHSCVNAAAAAAAVGTVTTAETAAADKQSRLVLFQNTLVPAFLNLAGQIAANSQQRT